MKLPIMTGIFFFLGVFMNSPFTDPTYPSQWKAVDQHMSKGKPNEALKIVEEIIQMAKTDEASIQEVKGIQYKANLLTSISEEGTLAAIEYLRALKNDDNKLVSILTQYTLAQKLKSYLQANYWKLRDRNFLEGTPAQEVKEWDVRQVEKEIINLYRIVLVNQKILLEEQTTNYTELINLGDNSVNLVPTIYEFLAHDFVDYLNTGRSYIPAGSTDFIAWEAQHFNTTNEFTNLKLPTPGVLDRKLIALKHLQELISVQVNNEDDNPLIHSELKRLEFVNKQASFSKKPTLYKKALEQLFTVHKNSTEAGMILVKKAKLIAQQEHDNNKSKEVKINKEVLDIVNSVKMNYKNSVGASLAQNMIDNLENSQLQLNGEKVYPKNQSLLFSVNYKNIDDLHYELYELPMSEYNMIFRGNRDHIKSNILKLNRIDASSLSFENTKEYTQFRTEFMLSSKKSGAYVLVLKGKSAFHGQESHWVYSIFHVSNLALRYDRSSANPEMFVYDRVTGEAIKNAKLSFYSNERNGRDVVFMNNPFDSKTTNNQGKILPPQINQRQVFVEITTTDDILQLPDGIYLSNYRHRVNNFQGISLFTDRAIYRPGQKVYVKGIAFVQNNKQVPVLLKQHPVTLAFYDNNGQEVGKEELITNEFGSVECSFVAPATGLNGHMTISGQNISGNVSVRVEEYKRPKFKVEFEPNTETNTIGEDINMVGFAKSFAGTAIENAKVKYTVSRSVRYPYYWCWWYPMPAQASKILKTGELLSDVSGHFTISFTAEEAKNTNRFWYPVFQYTINADVTDVNGETRSGETNITVGKEAFYLTSDLANELNLDDLKEISLHAKNANGANVKAEVQIELMEIEKPTGPKINRYWAFPDLVHIPKASFEKELPQYTFDNNNNPEKWNTKSTVIAKNINIDGDFKFQLNSKLNIGNYKLIAKDGDGNIVLQKYFSTYSIDKKELNTDQDLFYQTNKKAYEPGEIISLNLGSKWPNVWIQMSIEKNNQIVSREWIQLKGLKTKQIPVTEADRGGFTIHLNLVAQNRQMTIPININVPWTNKKLSLEMESFRDKVLPGENETYKIKIKDADGHLADAELMAAMYDASLDEFIKQNWNLVQFPKYYGHLPLAEYGLGQSYGRNFVEMPYQRPNGLYRNFPSFKYLHYQYYGGGRMMRGNRLEMKSSAAPMSRQLDGVMITESESNSDQSFEMEESSNKKVAGSGQDDKGTSTVKKDFSPRVNLNELVFFKPQLQTNDEGVIEFEFKMNEALTTWNLMFLAHDKEFASVQETMTVQTQKDLMVFPQFPRFLREQDTVVISTKINKLVDKAIRGNVEIVITDAITNADLTSTYILGNSVQKFGIDEGEVTTADWNLTIPKGKLNPIEMTIKARSGQHTDGEVNQIPVLSNRILVTETIPMSIDGLTDKTFSFSALDDIFGKDIDINNFAIEVTQNPVWYAVQALPYLMEYPYDGTEHLAHRLFANSLASYITKLNPNIEKIFKEWEAKGELTSNLNKNEELKSATLEETPWVRNAKSEEEQMQNIAHLFNYEKIQAEQKSLIKKIQSRQYPSGGFVWFPQGRESAFVTQSIIEMFGHLRKLGVDLIAEHQLEPMMRNAINYCDIKMVDRYLLAKKSGKPSLDYTSLHYLYVRSFFNDLNIDFPRNDIFSFYLNTAENKWLDHSNYSQAMIAIIMHRNDKSVAAAEILASFEDRFIRHEEIGTYLKYSNSSYWYERPLRSHTMVMEATSEIKGETKDLDQMRVWLLKNKQTNRWTNTSTTASSIYALLNGKQDWVNNSKALGFKFNGELISQKNVGLQKPYDKESAQAGTGYFKIKMSADKITASNSFEMENPNQHISWAAAYIQYLDKIDNIEKDDDQRLTVKRTIYRVINGTNGQSLEPLLDGDQIQVGDKVELRMQFEADRPMEFIHLKDIRSAGLEPIDVLSGRKWTDGLSYFQSTTDLASHFFIEYLPKGSYELRYQMFASNAGKFAGGMSNLQCMYAPEFAAHSEGNSLRIKR